MTGDEINPLSEVEVLNVMRNMAKMARTLYLELQEQGFMQDEAFKLVLRYMHGAAGGKAE